MFFMAWLVNEVKKNKLDEKIVLVVNRYVATTKIEYS